MIANIRTWFGPVTTIALGVAAACGSDPEASPAASGTEGGAPTATATNTVPPAPAGSDAGSDAGKREPTIALATSLTTATCVVKADQSVVCWGDNSQFALGRVTATREDPTPAPIPGLSASKVVLRTINCSHHEGKVSCWGKDLGPEDACAINGLPREQSGASDGGPAPVPVDVQNADELAPHAIGGCARSGSSVTCWGDTSRGIMGTYDAGSRCSPPAPIGMTDVKALGTVGNGVCALKTDGTVWCWGETLGFGEFGRQLPGEPGFVLGRSVSLPRQVQGLSDVRALAGGAAHMCALKNDGSVWCWGYNAADGSDTSRPGGQLGHAGGYDVVGVGWCDPDPKPVAGLTDVREIAAGGTHTCAVKNDDTVVCWGDITDGRLGQYFDPFPDGGLDMPTPLPVLDLSNVAHISAGRRHTCAVTRDDRVLCWGSNRWGELGFDDGGRPASFRPVEVVLP